MSLFSTRSWWATEGGGGDDACDCNSLCLLKTAAPKGGASQASIAVGTFTGLLRLYSPRQRGFQPEDVRLEHQFDQAILQLCTGRFVADGPSTADQLAILHPRKLSIVTFQDGKDACEMVVLFEHRLDRTAANMVHGPFDQTAGADTVCVQSMDGVLTFLTHEGTSFHRSIPGFLLPGPLCYLEASNSFITATVAFTVEAYRYIVLVSASQDEAPARGRDTAGQLDHTAQQPGASSGKRVKADWTANVGEHVVDIQIARTTSPCVVVLGERTIFWLKDNGVLRLSKRFESPPVCIYPYRIVDDEINLLVATLDSQLVVLNDTRAIWAAKLPVQPVALRVASLGGLRGLVVAVDDTCRVQVLFLGTDPEMPIMPTPEARQLDYAAMDEEMRRLQAVIRSTVLGETPVQPEGVLSISAAVSPAERPPCATVTLMCPGKAPVYDVSVRLHVASGPMQPADPCVTIPHLGGDQTEGVARFHFNTVPTMLPSSSRCTATAVYMFGKEPRSVSSECRLPLSALASPCAPSKAAPYKVTLGCSKPVPLPEIFSEFGGSASTSSGYGFRYAEGSEVTVLTSKTKGKYRVQSNSFEALSLLVQELVLRLGGHQGDSRVSYKDPLPLKDYFITIDEHLAIRRSLADLHTVIGEQAHQFRTLQKRLLSRFKDKTPSGLQHLDTLLESTYHELLKLSDQEAATQEALRIASNRLSCDTRLILTLLRCVPGVKLDVLPEVEAAFCADLVDSAERGWEEVAFASLSHLLKTTLAKSAKDISVNPPSLQMPDSTAKLQRQIFLVCERLQGNMSQ